MLQNLAGSMQKRIITRTQFPQELGSALADKVFGPPVRLKAYFSKMLPGELGVIFEKSAAANSQYPDVYTLAIKHASGSEEVRFFRNEMARNECFKGLKLEFNYANGLAREQVAEWLLQGAGSALISKHNKPIYMVTKHASVAHIVTSEFCGFATSNYVPLNQVDAEIKRIAGENGERAIEFLTKQMGRTAISLPSRATIR